MSTSEPNGTPLIKVTVAWRDLRAFKLVFSSVLLVVVASALTAIFFSFEAIRMSLDDRSIRIATGASIAAIVFLLLGCFMARRRIRYVRSVIQNGPHVKGRVIDQWFSLPYPLSKKMRGWVQFVYVHDGREYHAKVDVVRRPAVMIFEVGDEVLVAVDPQDVNSAFPIELFTR